MADYAQIERTLTGALNLSRRPVAVAFRETPPPGVEQFTGSQPSSCSFWRLAREGRVFYTVPSDHYNCPVGSYTHNVPLPAEREQELPEMLSVMADIGYIRMEEVPYIQQLPKTPAVAIYAPLGQTPVDPDIVIVAGTPRHMMLLHEAAVRSEQPLLPMMGRPTCMAIPAALSSGVASSMGCIGNRVYTDVPDDAFYSMVAGRDLAAIAEQMRTIVDANATLEAFHRERRATLSTA